MICWAGGANAQLFSTRASEAYMIDAETGTILFSKNADKPIPPASLAKLMTMELVFHAIKAGRLALDSRLARATLGWAPALDPAETLALTARWYESWRAGEDVLALSDRDVAEVLG